MTANDIFKPPVSRTCVCGKVGPTDQKSTGDVVLVINSAKFSVWGCSEECIRNTLITLATELPISKIIQEGD